MQCFLLIDR